MTQRIRALDAFRGLAIFAMVLVNNPGTWGAIFAPLKHASWHGLTPTDLIFPGFIFIMGVTIAIHLPREAERLGNRLTVLATAAKRALILILLGWGLYLFWYSGEPDFNWVEDRLLNLRYLGVLPRLGLVYVLTVAVVSALHGKRLGVAALALLAGYWAAMTFIPYSDASGELYRGMWAFGNSFAAYLDHHLLGAQHLYYSNASPFAFDPEGVLSTIPAVATCLSGVWVGQYLLLRRASKAKLFMVAALAIVAGYGLAAWVPVNKALWTPTFVLVSSGMLTIILLLFLWHENKYGSLADGHPLLVAGTNSIAFYMLSGVLARLVSMIQVNGSSVKAWFYGVAEAFIGWPELASLIVALVFTLICYVPIRYMYSHKIFWRI
ncbi:acyltransferase family protein [Alteromonas gilva]|uniref:DUF5009 domain-containing protein n=1 Tax=Alteromonas gilva TaxID=2987522 RepID=A0ABT5L702_9ALTE|nr:DUF5009 domain-containing protein [Alteromonas gilva]MDC8832194.1 DUF5009 domain-containing protein [Alteromonas gilva]